MSSISLQCGDCLELMNNISDKSVDCIITDLPYQQTSRNKWDVIIPFEPLWEQYKRITKDNAAIILFADGLPSESQVNDYMDLCLHLLQRCHYMIDEEK